MSENEEDDNEKNYFRILIVIIVTVLIIILVGLFFWQESKREKIEGLEKKKVRLKEVEDRIKILQQKKEKIERNEKCWFFAVRFLIGLLIIYANYKYITYNSYPFSISIIVNFNELLILAYGFIAYVTYGTIDNFVSSIKSKFTRQFRKYHIASLEELELLKKERDLLIQEITEIEKNISLI